MISAAILCAYFYAGSGSGKREEVRALELGPDFFTFRLKKGMEKEILTSCPQIGFGSIREKGCRWVKPTDYAIKKTGEEKYFDLYRFESADPEFKVHIAALKDEYMRYIELRMDCTDAQLSHELTGYDVDEEKFPDTLDRLRTEFFGSHPFENPGEESAERGICLSFPAMWEAYLKQEKCTFIREWFIKYASAQISVDKIGITHLYFGSQVCHLRWPDRRIAEILDKTIRDEMVPVIVFAPMQEAFTDLYKERAEKLVGWCRENERTLEIVCNDLGQLEMLRAIGGDCFNITMGVMTVRHRKDTRIKWRCTDAPGNMHTWIDEPENRRILRQKYGVTGVSYEQCADGTEVLPDNGWRKTVYTPYYQMNTSAMCTLYASIVNGDRGRQEQNKGCPYYCQERCFLYPQQLNMVGIGNTLFGIDPDAWNKEKQIKGADRYVLNFM